MTQMELEEIFAEEKAPTEAATSVQGNPKSSTNDNTEELIDAIKVVAVMALENRNCYDVMWNLYQIMKILRGWNEA